LYYLFCIKLGRSEEEYYRSSLAKVIAMIELWREEQEAITNAMQDRNMTDAPVTVQKFSDIRGLV